MIEKIKSLPLIFAITTLFWFIVDKIIITKTIEHMVISMSNSNIDINHILKIFVNNDLLYLWLFAKILISLIIYYVLNIYFSKKK
jgi:hypothetical protein